MTAKEFKKKHNYVWYLRCGRHYCCWCKNHVITAKVHHWGELPGPIAESVEELLVCKACGRGFTTSKLSGCDAWEGG